MISLDDWAETVEPEWRPLAWLERGVSPAREGEGSWVNYEHYRKVVKAKALERYMAALRAPYAHIHKVPM